MSATALSAAVSSAQADTAAAAGQAQYLTFNLGGRTFALGISGVKEIIKFGQVTAVPRTPPHIRGVINLRGAVLPVLDLNVYVGQPSVPADGQTCIIVIEAEGSRGPQPMGLMVDSVSAVLTLQADRIEPPPSFGSGLPAGVLLGMTPAAGAAAGQFIAVLDARRAFSVQALAQRGWLPTGTQRLQAAA